MAIDLFVAAPLRPALMDQLARRGRISCDVPAPGTVAIIGGGSMRVDAATIAALPALRLIAVHGVGYDRIDVAAAAAHGVAVTTTPDTLTDDVADLAVGLMLATERRIAANDRALRAGEWHVPLTRRFSGRRVGIVGLGRIGGAVAHRLTGFGADIAYSARNAKAVPWRFLPDPVALAAFADILIVTAPGGGGTRHLIDAAVLDALGPAGVLVNVARGSLVDQDALITALLAGRLGGAGLDVFADEPEVPAALLSLDTVVLSPHQGSATHEARAAMAALVLANIDAVLAGRPPVTPVDAGDR